MGQFAKEESDSKYFKRFDWFELWNRCVNYTGAETAKTCDFDIPDTHPELFTFRAYNKRLTPCYQENKQGHKCPYSKFLTVEEAKEAYAIEEEKRKAARIEIAEHIRQQFEKSMNGRCHDCQEPAVAAVVGNQIIAQPCGHRLSYFWACG